VVIFEKLFKRGPSRAAGEKLYETAIRQARQPAFYADLGAPDTVEGRFELYTLHVVLVLSRLKAQGDVAAETAQALFDTYLQALDDALREMGVGDLSVSKKMRKLGEAFYGRAKAYQAALDQGDHTALAALIGRTVYEGQPDTAATRLADYVERSAALLAGLPLDDVLAAELAWPEIVP
jgi:cytochrome b pre-mRNA-processing protein 3